MASRRTHPFGGHGAWRCDPLNIVGANINKSQPRVQEKFWLLKNGRPSMGVGVRENMAPGRGSGKGRFPVDRCTPTRPAGTGKTELDAGEQCVRDASTPRTGRDHVAKTLVGAHGHPPCAATPP